MSIQSLLPAEIRLIRPHQWVKNLFIFIAPFFGGAILEEATFYELCLGFIAFSFLASAVYIINDIGDRKADRQHPAKMHRPIASGKVSIPKAILFIVLLMTLTVSIAYYLNINFLYLCLIYFFINILYSNGLKKVAILDIMLVASGFVIRILSGGVISDTPVSNWLILMVFLLALFLAMAKKFDDLILVESHNIDQKLKDTRYNIAYITSGITMISGIIIVCYIMYSISEQHIQTEFSEYIYLTSVFVIAGILRYLQIILVDRNNFSPTKILYKDPFIIITILLWASSYLVIIYF